ncbi:hypothetical protein PU629_14285 [Pullulanibacillus sp. KACC 23026]|uniref:YpoC family protein n=1 Tax=Pullulanibacillus sp. KACC 23026 TaxID=3028315 RepID=UPI0023B12740|nr:hypothetical protein [Pullulanibacillus sp. KACC 23026]WEG11329.1 hypothetical protein PU629_14285 [Pullulanibacillus sp. KACC 23026]
MGKLKVPSAFFIAPFYKAGAEIDVDNVVALKETLPFYFDICYALNIELEQEWPWSSEKGADQCLTYWNEQAPIIESFFNKRKTKAAAPFMVKAVEAFICYLYWSEGIPVDFSQIGLDALKERKLAPVNVLERVSFICESPNHYHAYIQLTSLFDEAKKKRALYKIKQKG